MHHFTVDVEEYFHPTALAGVYPRDSWDDLPRRSPRVVEKLLGFLERNRITATFFVLGWLAEREPSMVRAIAEDGHEIASHGFGHELVANLGEAGFRDSVRRSKELLEDLAGREVRGYRAPSFSIVPGLEWAWDILLEEGYQYDASVFPVSQHPTYGYPDADPHPHWMDREGGRLLEVPASTARLLGSTLPAAGGAYFRLLPYGLVRRGLTQAGRADAVGTFYIHPWELDEWTPSAKMSALTRLRTFGGMRRIWTRLERLTREFGFRPVSRTLDEMRRRTAQTSTTD